MIRTNLEDVSVLRQLVDRAIEARQDRLPAEPALSEALGLSRSRLRTALKCLEDEGVIWRHVGRGTFVGPRRTDSERAADICATIGPNDVIEARLILEPQLAALAATRARPGDIATMTQSLDEMHNARTFAQWKLGDDRLHRAIAVAARNTLLLHQFDSTHILGRGVIATRIEQVFGNEHGTLTSTHNEHHELVAAIKDHDPQRADALMRKHVLSIQRALFGNQQ